MYARIFYDSGRESFYLAGDWGAVGVEQKDFCGEQQQCAFRGPTSHCIRLNAVFNLFGRSKRSNLQPPRAPGNTVRAKDLRYLQQWASQRSGVEGFVEPETVVNEMSVVFVDASGEWTRRKIGGPQGIDVVHKQTGVPLYFAEETGYPQRMRDRIEKDRIIRVRLKQRERRARLDEERARRGEDSGS